MWADDFKGSLASLPGQIVRLIRPLRDVEPLAAAAKLRYNQGFRQFSRPHVSGLPSPRRLG
jgi:hypothetical protein